MSSGQAGFTTGAPFRPVVAPFQLPFQLPLQSTSATAPGTVPRSPLAPAPVIPAAFAGLPPPGSPLIAQPLRFGLAETGNAQLWLAQQQGTITDDSSLTVGPANATLLPGDQPPPSAETIASVNGDTTRLARQGTQLEIPEYNGWYQAGDAVRGFFGGDPQTVAGIAGNVTGGVFIVGDIGSLLKNGWRALGLSSEEPNALEASLSALGLGTELAVGVGETADVPISITRAIVATVGKGPFSDALIWILQRSLGNVNDLGRLATALPMMIRDATSFKVASEVLTSNESIEQFVKLSDSMGERAMDALTRVALDSSVEAAQAALRVFDGLNPGVITRLNALPDDQLNSVMTGLGRIVYDNAEAGARAIDPQQLANMMNDLPQQILRGDGGYGMAELVGDLDSLRLVPGFAAQVGHLARQGGYSWKLGRIYEIQAAADIARMTGQEPAAVVSHLGRWVSMTDETGQLARTDIDVIADGVYFQVKRSTDALTSFWDPVTQQVVRSTDPDDWIAAMDRWVALARADGGSDAVIRYYLPTLDGVPRELIRHVEQLRVEQGINIDWVVQGGAKNW